MTTAQEKRLTVAVFEAHAAATDQLNAQIDTPVLGLVEVGSLVSALKKRRRETHSFFGYHETVVEELGDVLWYVSAIARRGGTSLVEEIGRAAGNAHAPDALRFANLGAGRSIAAEAFEAALLELAGEAGDLAKRFAVGAYRDNTDGLRGDLIKFVRPLNQAALASHVTLEEAGSAQHRKDRGPLADRASLPGPDRRRVARGRAAASADAGADLMSVRSTAPSTCSKNPVGCCSGIASQTTTSPKTIIGSTTCFTWRTPRYSAGRRRRAPC